MAQKTKDTLSFRLDGNKRKELDKLARFMDRDRSYLLDEAVENYLDHNRWMTEHIKAAVREADAGNFATDKEVEAFYNKHT